MDNLGRCCSTTLQKAPPLSSPQSTQNQTVWRSDPDKGEMFFSCERPGEKFRRVSNWLPSGWPGPSSQSSCYGPGCGEIGPRAQPAQLTLDGKGLPETEGLLRYWRDSQRSWENSSRGLLTWGEVDLPGDGFKRVKKPGSSKIFSSKN